MDFKTCVKGLQHLGLPTNDMEKTVEFYKKIGFEVKLDTVNEAAGEHVVFLELGNVVIESYENKQAAMKHGAIDHVCLDVADIEAAYALAKEAGLEILDDEIQFLPFWENGVRFFNVLGPNHEKVEFGQIL